MGNFSEGFQNTPVENGFCSGWRESRRSCRVAEARLARSRAVVAADRQQQLGTGFNGDRIEQLDAAAVVIDDHVRAPSGFAASHQPPPPTLPGVPPSRSTLRPELLLTKALAEMGEAPQAAEYSTWDTCGCRAPQPDALGD